MFYANEHARTALNKVVELSLLCAGRKAVLQINGKRITSHHEQKLNKAATSQTLKEYIQNNSGWKDE